MSSPEDRVFLSSSFTDRMAFITHLIRSLASETEDYDVILKKRKIVDPNIPLSIEKPQPQILRKSLKNRHKNCPKLFGRAFFRLLLKNREFKRENLTVENLLIKAPNSKVPYPESYKEEISISKYLDWLKENNYHRIYNNLNFYREMWKYWKLPEENEMVKKEQTEEKQEKNEKNMKKWIFLHYKFFTTRLMKEFFETYAVQYVINSKIQGQNGIKYLNLIPHFLRGIEDPERFTCLKWEKKTRGKIFKR